MHHQAKLWTKWCTKVCFSSCVAVHDLSHRRQLGFYRPIVQTPEDMFFPKPENYQIEMISWLIKLTHSIGRCFPYINPYKTHTYTYPYIPINIHMYKDPYVFICMISRPFQKCILSRGHFIPKICLFQYSKFLKIKRGNSCPNPGK